MPSKTTERQQLDNGYRMRLMAQHLLAESIDRLRDREFYEPETRFITSAEVEALTGVLIDTDDSLEIGLSQIGIDPEELEEDDLEALTRALKNHGVVFDEEADCWVQL